MPTERTTSAGGRIEVRLLGRFALTTNGAEVELGHREQRLAAVLALNGRRPRVHVAGILWPETTDDRALASLRRAILHTQRRSPGLLRPDRTTIGLGENIQTDGDRLRRAIDRAVRPDGDDESAPIAPVLTGEELLVGWYDDWVVVARERLQQQRLRALEKVARRALDAGDLSLAIEAAAEASALEPLLESTRELAIHAHLLRGDLAGAAREFRQYQRELRVELGIAPSRNILALVSPMLGDHAALAGAAPVLRGSGLAGR